MSENDNPIPRLSFVELERRTRVERNLVVNALMHGVARAFAEWLRALAQRSARRLRSLAAEGRRRSAIRTLQKLDDRTLADMGVGRCEIEFAVRSGRSEPTIRKLRPRGWSSIPPNQRAA